MARRQRTVQRSSRAAGEVGPRQPCPCGSGKRYKACHGAGEGAGAPFVARSFAGLPGECDLVALREFVQAGSAPLTLRAGVYDGAADGVSILVVSLLPGVAPALKRADGDVWVAAQVAHRSGDPSTDLAQALGRALTIEPGEAVAMPELADAGTRLQDVVDPETIPTVTVHDGFDFWFAGIEDPEGTIESTLQQLNDSLEPAARLTSVEAAYWVSTGSKEHVRWVLPHEEEKVLTALARLHAAGDDELVGGSRLVGSFRAHGLLVPVWDVPFGTGAQALEGPVETFAQRLGEALADSSPLTDAQRSARNGLANRQLTVR